MKQIEPDMVERCARAMEMAQCGLVVAMIASCNCDHEANISPKPEAHSDECRYRVLYVASDALADAQAALQSCGFNVMREERDQALEGWRELSRIVKSCFRKTDGPDRVRWEGVWYEGPLATAYNRTMRAIEKMADFYADTPAATPEPDARLTDLGCATIGDLPERLFAAWIEEMDTVPERIAALLEEASVVLGNVRSAPFPDTPKEGGALNTETLVGKSE